MLCVESEGAAARYNKGVRPGWSRRSILPGDHLVGVGATGVHLSARFEHVVEPLANKWPLHGTVLLHWERGAEGECPDGAAVERHFQHVERDWQDFASRYFAGSELAAIMNEVARR